MSVTCAEHDQGSRMHHLIQEYSVWIRGVFSGKVLASDEQDARIQAARLYMASLRDVSVLPPY